MTESNTKKITPADVHAKRLDKLISLYLSLTQRGDYHAGRSPAVTVDDPVTLHDETRRRTYQLTSVWLLPDGQDPETGKDRCVNVGFAVMLIYGHGVTVRVKAWGRGFHCEAEIAVPEIDGDWESLRKLAEALMPPELCESPPCPNCGQSEHGTECAAEGRQ